MFLTKLDAPQQGLSLNTEISKSEQRKFIHLGGLVVKTFCNSQQHL